MLLDFLPALAGIPAVVDPPRPRRLERMRRHARMLCAIEHLPGGHAFLRHARAVPPASWLVRGHAGQFRPFPSIAAANAAIAADAAGGHVNPENAELHLHLAEALRPSDYPALFHLMPRAPRLRRVFDLGGNVGNLLYSYARHLRFHDELAWVVHDLPAVCAAGAAIAARRGQARLAFTDDFADAAKADLLIASGSLHYFEDPLPAMLAQLDRLPPLVLINRTPLAERRSVATVQDGGTYLVACRLHDRAVLCRGFEQLGYRLADEWPALELSLKIPAFPECSAAAYSGMFLVHAEATDGQR
jgi:putative methyltransferase (TIGR04325 family)